MAAPLRLGLIFAPSLGGAAGALVAETLPRRVGLPIASTLLPIVMATAFPSIISSLQLALLKIGSGLLRWTSYLSALQGSMQSELHATKVAFGLAPAPIEQLGAPSIHFEPLFAHVPKNPGTKKRAASRKTLISMSTGDMGKIYLENIKRQKGLTTRAPTADPVVADSTDPDDEHDPVAA